MTSRSIKCVTYYHNNYINHTTLHWIWHLVSQILVVLLNTNCKPRYSVTDTKCEPDIICHTLFIYLLFLFIWGVVVVIGLQCCNYCHFPSGIFHPNFNHPWPIFHHKLLTREGQVSANGWTHPPTMTILVHSFIRSVIQKVTIVI